MEGLSYDHPRMPPVTSAKRNQPCGAKSTPSYFAGEADTVEERNKHPHY
jgi:hypothetical protein